MENLNVDIDPLQVVRWLLAERRAGRRDLQVTAFRSYEWQALPDESGPPLGDQEREEIGEVVLRGRLEIAPADPHGGWIIRLETEDEIGPRAPEDESVPLTEEELDFDAFAEEMVLPDRARMEVTAEARDADAKRRLMNVLRAIEVDRHRSGRETGQTARPRR